MLSLSKHEGQHPVLHHRRADARLLGGRVKPGHGELFV
jgi:hypothetical protein